jgi:hypothetical protein
MKKLGYADIFRMKNIYRIFLSFIFIISPAFADSSPTLEVCTDKAIDFFKDVVAKDKDNILAKQYELTMLKLARATAKESRSTLEEYISKVSKQIDPKDPKLKKLDELYKAHGYKEDLKTILENFKTANHWNRKNRMYNDDISSFILLSSQMNPSLKLNKRDAAITWFMNSVSNQANSRFGKGSAKANKLNLTNRLNKYTGAIAGNRSLTDGEFAMKISKLQKDLMGDIQSMHHSFLIDFDSSCFKGAKFAGECFYSKNDTESLLSMALNELATDINQQEVISLEGDVFSIKGDYNIDLINLPRYNEYEKLRPLSLIPPKLDYTSIADIRIHDSYWVNQKDIKKLEDKLNILDDESKIKAFHQHADSDNYIILDKAKGLIKVFNKTGTLVESKNIDLIGEIGDKKSLGGSGSYNIHSVKNGVVYIQDNRGNVRPLTGVTLSSIKVETPFYILPINKDHHFKIKGGKIHFTTHGKKADYAPFNFTKRDGAVKKSKTVITNKNYQTKVALDFMNNIDKEKSRIIKMYGITNHEYNELSKLAFGILGNESQFGDSNKYWLKEAAPSVIAILKGNGLDTSRNSRGPTQIKTVPKKIASRYGVTKDSLERPRHAAVATMGFLAEALDELKAKEKYHPSITPENRFDYIHYIYMGKSSEITKATATPNKNIYFKQIRNYNKGLEVYEKID